MAVGRRLKNEEAATGSVLLFSGLQPTAYSLICTRALAA
jgi:hypothetical protein